MNLVFFLEEPSGQKVAGSQAIGAHLSLTDNRSHSFSVFVCALKRIANPKIES